MSGERERLAAALEDWRPVVGWEDRYEVSSAGRVRSLLRPQWTEGALRTQTNRHGYLHVALFRDGKRTWGRVHRLVAEAFLRQAPGQDVVRHLDGDKLNNRVENLRFGTAAENAGDTLRHGRHPEASRTHCVNGHEFTTENTWIDEARGHRQCRRCKTERSRSRRARLRLTSDSTRTPERRPA